VLYIDSLNNFIKSKFNNPLSSVVLNELLKAANTPNYLTDPNNLITLEQFKTFLVGLKDIGLVDISQFLDINLSSSYPNTIPIQTIIRAGNMFKR
jgi:hypothetical protein